MNETQIAETAICDMLLEDTLKTMSYAINETRFKPPISNCGFTIDSNLKPASPMVCGTGFSVDDLPLAKKEKGSHHTHHKPEHYLGSPRPTAADVMGALSRGHDFICISETTRPNWSFCYSPRNKESWAARKILERWRRDKIEEIAGGLFKKYGTWEEASKHWSEITRLELIRLWNEQVDVKTALEDTLRDEPEKLFKSCSVKLTKGRVEEDLGISELAEGETEGLSSEEITQEERLWRQIWGGEKPAP